MFDDSMGIERVNFQAQRNLDSLIKNDETRIINHDRTYTHHHASRTGIQFHIHKIALKTMRLMAQKYGLIQFRSAIVTYENNMPADIKSLMGNKPREILYNPNQWGVARSFTLPNNSAATKRFRNK